MRLSLLVWGALVAGCGDTKPSKTGSADFASTGSAAIDASAGSGSALPASAAGTSTEDGPGVPEDFSGTITDSIPLSPAELEAIEKANARSAARNDKTQSPVDRGFAPAKEAP